MSTTKPNDIIGNRTRDLPACSSVQYVCVLCIILITRSDHTFCIPLTIWTCSMEATGSKFDWHRNFWLEFQIILINVSTKRLGVAPRARHDHFTIVFSPLKGNSTLRALEWAWQWRLHLSTTFFRIRLCFLWGTNQLQTYVSQKNVWIVVAKCGRNFEVFC
jgi:hypothetical protein